MRKGSICFFNQRYLRSETLTYLDLYILKNNEPFLIFDWLISEPFLMFDGLISEPFLMFDWLISEPFLMFDWLISEPCLIG